MKATSRSVLKNPTRAILARCRKRAGELSWQISKRQSRDEYTIVDENGTPLIVNQPLREVAAYMRVRWVEAEPAKPEKRPAFLGRFLGNPRFGVNQ